MSPSKAIARSEYTQAVDLFTDRRYSGYVVRIEQEGETVQYLRMDEGALVTEPALARWYPTKEDADAAHSLLLRWFGCVASPT